MLIESSLCTVYSSGCPHEFLRAYIGSVTVDSPASATLDLTTMQPTMFLRLFDLLSTPANTKKIPVLAIYTKLRYSIHVPT